MAEYFANIKDKYRSKNIVITTMHHGFILVFPGKEEPVEDINIS